MKTFSEFTPETHHVPDEPIHFKHVGRLTEELLYEKVARIARNMWVNHSDEDNTHLQTGAAEHGPDHVSETLAERAHAASAEEAHHVRKHTIDSYPTNHALIAAHKTGQPHPAKFNERVKHLDSVTRHPLGTHLHVYSGVGFNPADHGKTIHLPAYTSVTHDRETAVAFAERHPAQHIIHIHLKAKDKAAHVSHLSANEHEHETILPRGTTLKLHGKPDIHDAGMDRKGKPNPPLHVWHATVHHQEEH